MLNPGAGACVLSNELSVEKLKVYITADLMFEGRNDLMNDSVSQVRVLVIDDEPAIRQSFRYYLEDMEFVVETADNGRLGLEMIKKELPDLVLSDLRMPEMDGFEVLKHCRELAPEMPVIVISGANRIDEAVSALRLGAWDYLIKPLKDLTILGHSVKRALERAQLLQENRAHQEHLELLVKERTNDLESAFDELKKSERKYRALFEKTNDAIFIVEKNTGIFLDANNSALHLTDQTLDELQHKKIKEILHVKGYEQFQTLALTNKAEEMGQVSYYRPDGTKRVGIVSLVPMNKESVIVIARDITRSIEVEEQLRQAQKMEAIGTLAGGIAHDFNNILTAILGYSELCLMEIDAEHPLRSKITAIAQSGDRAKELVYQILAFSRSDEQVTIPVRMDLILKETLKLLRPAIPSSINIDLHINTKTSVMGEPTRLHQIFMNLCTNAYQAVDETDGVLKIDLHSVELDENSELPQNLPAGSYVELSVSDNGCGMTAETISRIFDPYYTTKEKGKGTGMGLAVVHGIVKNHGGEIVVTSELGVGTEFKIYLPMTQIGGYEMRENKMVLPVGDEDILLVDDEIDIIKIEEEILRNQGYNVVSTIDAEEALALFWADPEQFDLIITDMTMPKLTGLRLTEKIKEINPEMKVVICSGYNEHLTEKNCHEKGVDGYITKPIAMEKLVQTVRRVLDEKPGNETVAN